MQIWNRGRRRRCASVAFLCMAVAVSSLACARYQYVNIRSEPAGASVFLDGKEVGRTPLRMAIDRTTDHLVFLKLEGYRPEREVLRLNRVPDTIDFLTPADVELRLGRGAASAAAPDGSPSSQDVEVEVERPEGIPER